MSGHSLPPTPQNYAIWYEYVAETNLPLRREVDEILDRDGTLGKEASTELYEKYFTDQRESEALKETKRLVQKSMEDVLTDLGETSGDTERFLASLEVFSANLASGNGSGNTAQMNNLVSGVINETRRVEKQTSVLHNRLQQASNEIEDLKRQLEIIQKEALTDVLTGIPNRKFFDTRLKEMTRLASSTGETLCLLMADIDHFKQFNDTHGHQFGDQVLKLVAQVLKDSLKGQDVATRFGGEEFAIILPRTMLNNAVTVANHIREAVTQKKLIKRSTGQDIGRITMSFGVARYRPDEKLDQFIERSDAALYAAKKSGRNKVMSELDLPWPTPA